MNRRDFIRIGGTGLVTVATMQQAGMWTEFMDWVRRAPAWSFHSPVRYSPLWDEVSAATLEYFRSSAWLDHYFVDSPILTRLKDETVQVPA